MVVKGSLQISFSMEEKKVTGSVLCGSLMIRNKKNALSLDSFQLYLRLEVREVILKQLAKGCNKFSIIWKFKIRECLSQKYML